MALQAGLKVIFNPLHLMRSLDTNEQTLRWVWATVLEDFPLDEFPAHIARGLSEALGARAARLGHVSPAMCRGQTQVDAPWAGSRLTYTRGTITHR